MENDLKETLRRNAPVLPVLALLAVVLAAQTVAYITREFPTHSFIAFGSVDVKASITTLDDMGAEVPAQDGDKLFTGVDGAHRVVRVVNTGDHALWVRLSLDVTMTDSAGDCRSVTEYATFEGSNSAWVQGPDGMWYCTVALEPGQTSEPVCTAMRLDTAAAQAQYGPASGYGLTANVQGVQYENNHTSIFDAEGWPAL